MAVVHSNFPRALKTVHAFLLGFFGVMGSVNGQGRCALTLDPEGRVYKQAASRRRLHQAAVVILFEDYLWAGSNSSSP